MSYKELVRIIHMTDGDFQNKLWLGSFSLIKLRGAWGAVEPCQ
jgi:hypothetical protein